MEYLGIMLLCLVMGLGGQIGGLVPGCSRDGGVESAG